MRAGLLNERCDLLRATKTTDAYGASKSEWAVLLSGIPCRVTYGQGGFGEHEGEAVYTRTTTFQTRWIAEVSEYDRLRWQGLDWRITAIERYRERGELKIVCERVNNG